MKEGTKKCRVFAILPLIFAVLLISYTNRYQLHRSREASAMADAEIALQ